MTEHALPPGACLVPRIASLVPSLTELMVALGLGANLVARTGFCIHPAEEVRGIPKVGGTKDVNLARLRAVAPTHVLVNMDENRQGTVQAIHQWPAEVVPQIVVTHPVDPQDNLALIEQMLVLFRHVPGVEDHALGLKRRLDHELALTQPEARATQNVLYLIWRNPWMTVARDTYLSRMLARVAWLTLPGTVGGETGAARYPVVRGDEPWLGQVEQVLLSSEPYAFGERHLEEAAALCPQARVRLVDGEMLSWYGARAVPGLRYLRELADTLRR